MLRVLDFYLLQKCWKSFISKYTQKHLDHANKSAADEFKTVSTGVIQITEEAAVICKKRKFR